MSSTFDTLVAHPARVALATVDEGLAVLSEANLWTLDAAELLELRTDLETSRARLDAQVLAVTREVDRRGAAVATGAASTAASACGFAASFAIATIASYWRCSIAVSGGQAARVSSRSPS